MRRLRRRTGYHCKVQIFKDFRQEGQTCCKGGRGLLHGRSQRRRHQPRTRIGSGASGPHALQAASSVLPAAGHRRRQQAQCHSQGSLGSHIPFGAPPLRPRRPARRLQGRRNGGIRQYREEHTGILHHRERRRLSFRHRCRNGAQTGGLHSRLPSRSACDEPGDTGLRRDFHQPGFRKDDRRWGYKTRIQPEKLQHGGQKGCWNEGRGQFRYGRCLCGARRGVPGLGSCSGIPAQGRLHRILPQAFRQEPEGARHTRRSGMRTFHRAVSGYGHDSHRSYPQGGTRPGRET